LLLNESRGNGQIDNIAKLPVDGNLCRQLTVLLREAADEALARLVAALHRLKLAVPRNNLILADQPNAISDELHAKVVWSDANALIVGHKIPALQSAAIDHRWVRLIHVAGELNRWFLQPDANQ